MKRIIKTIFISLLCVTGIFGLVIGGMFLFGGFEDKLVYAEDLSFNVEQVISASPFPLRIDTNTESVTQNFLKLETSSGGANIIDFPETVKIGETFFISPVLNNDINFGGNVTLFARYAGSSSNQNVVAKCEILIDVPVESLTVKLSSAITTISQNVTVCQQDAEISSALTIEPLKSLMPYNIGTKNVTGVVDKVIFLEMVDKEGNALDNEIVQFFVNNESQNGNRVEVKYEYKDVDSDGRKEVVFKDSIIINTKNTQAEVFLRAYIYSTYKDQSKNTVENVVNLNVSETKNAKTGFTIGNYQIEDMTADTSDKSVYLYDDIKIYLNNPNAGPQDINLSMSLHAHTPLINISDFYLLENVFLNIDSTAFRTLSNAIDESQGGQYGLSVKYDGISTEKEEWYWKFSINDFMSYYNYLNEESPITATIKYKDETREHTKTFNIIPIIKEVTSIDALYDTTGGTAKTFFEVKSGDILNLTSQDFELKYAAGRAPTFNELAFYLSYNENSVGGISTIPTANLTYKVKFSFELSETGQISDFAKNGTWCTFYSANFVQGTNTCEITYESGVLKSLTSSTFEPNTPIYAEIELAMSSSPVGEELFYVETVNERVDITNFMTKFFEKIVETGSYSTLPYVSINNIRYYIDFDFYYDKGNAKFLLLKNPTVTTNSFKVQGIGDIYITVQLVYVDSFGEIFWLGQSTVVKVEVYEELTSLQAYRYESEDKYNENFSSSLSIEEDDDSENYIFITSSEIDALKNYVSYGYLEISFEQIFCYINTSGQTVMIDKTDYPGIEINPQAIEFGHTWLEVVKNNKIIGYRISYKVNPIFSIKIGEYMLENLFKIEVKVKISDNFIIADFYLSKENPIETKKGLEIKIIDKTVSSASFSYSTTSGNNGSTEEKALNLYASLNSNGEIIWDGINFDNNLKYFFKYNDDDTTGIIESMSTNISAIGTNISLSNLCTFYTIYDSQNMVGKGGLTLNNFPYKAEGILILLKIYSYGEHDFNSYYLFKESTQTFVKTQNDGLEAQLYLKVFGLQINIETKASSNFYGCKNKEIDLMGSEGIFNISLKTGNGSNITNFGDFSQFMTVNVNNPFVEYTSNKIMILKDFMKEEPVSLTFYIGSITNKIQINTGTTPSDSYSILLKSAFTATIEKTLFDAPSNSQAFATVTYEGEGPFSADDLLKIEISILSHNLDSSFNINSPILVNNNLLTFISVPQSFSAIVELKITKKEKLEVFTNTTTGTTNKYIIYNLINYYLSDNNKYYVDAVNKSDPFAFNDSIYSDDGSFLIYLDEGQTETSQHNISVNSLFDQSQLEVGTMSQNYFYFDAGEENALDILSGGIVFTGKLLDSKNEITNISINFENEVEHYLNVNAHMNATPFDTTSKNISIWSYDLNEDKEIRIIFTIDFSDGGKIIIEKVVKVISNLSIEFKNPSINTGDTLILTNASNYTYKKNGVINDDYLSLEFTSYFDYNNLEFNYNKTSFEFNSYYFYDESDVGGFVNFRVKAKEIKSYKNEKRTTIITFYFLTQAGSKPSYILIFEFEIELNFVQFESEFNILPLTTGETNKQTLELYDGIPSTSKDDISSVLVEFFDGESPADEMFFDFDSSTKIVQIWSTSDIAKDIIAKFTIIFNDGTVAKISAQFQVTV